MEEGGRQGQPLAFTATEVLRSSSLKTLELIGLEALPNTFSTIAARQALNLSHELQVLEHREIAIERELLRHVADQASDAFRVSWHLVPEDADVTLGRAQ